MYEDVSAGYIVGGLGILLAIGREAWSRFLSREARSEGLLIQQLTERIAAQEGRLMTLEAGLDVERTMRRAAEIRVQKLELYIVQLKAALHHHKIEVPGPEGLPE